MSDKRISMLPTNQLQPNPFQPRGKIKNDDIQELVTSIKTYGILEPLVIAQTPAGFQIIAGERRWRAARELGLEEVPVLVKKTSPRGMLEMAIVENVQRIDLTAIERAQAFQQLIRDFGFSHTQVAEKVSKSIAYVSNSLKLLTLPDAIKDGLVGGLISEGHARALNGLPNEQAMIDVYKTILKENASVRRAEELVRRYKDESGVKIDGRGKNKLIHSKNIDTWIKQLTKSFKSKNKVKLARSKRQTKINIVLNGTPEETQADLDKILTITKQKAA